MKKHIFWGATLLSLFVASCSNEDIIENDNENETGKTIILNANINNADSRLSYDDNGSKISIAWSDNETFTMYKGTNNTGSTFANSSTEKGTFKGSDITGEGTYYAVYGENITKANDILKIDLSSPQVGTNAENGIKEFMLATAKTLNSETILSFKHKLTVLRLNLTLPSDATGTVSMVSVRGLHNKANYVLSTDAYDTYTDDNKGVITATNGGAGFTIGSDKKITAYVAVFPENIVANQVTVIAKVGENGYSYTIKNTRELKEGKVVPVNVSCTKMEWYVETVKSGAKGSPFNGPANLAIKDGNLYILDNIADAPNLTLDNTQETIKKLNLSTLEVSDFYDLKNNSITSVKSLTCGHDGSFYVGANDGVWAISSDRVAIKKADKVSGEYAIHDVAENPINHQLFFINGGKSSIHIFDGDTNPSISEGYTYSQEGQMAWDPTGEHVYIAIMGNNQIDRFTYNKETKNFDKKESALYTITNSGDLLAHPRQMVFDSKGNMYVASKYRQTILKITPEGKIIKFAGSGNRNVKGNADGKALAATFNFPCGIALEENPDDPDHPTLYVGDTSNYAIRKIVYKSNE